MKTQRPRNTSAGSPASDANGQTDGVDSAGGADEAQGNGTANGSQEVAGRTLPPALPKRRASRPASEPAATAAAVTTVAEAPQPGKPAVTARQGQAAPTAGEATSAPAPPRWHAFITYENALWLGIFAFTLLTRFWDLGPRALHHDESLHAHFSRLLYAGQGYQHDPMMHGPLQFHLIAFMYWLFGTTDATARFASVFCGIFVTMSPFFLRKQLGRLTALVCAFLLLAAPSILYFGRMAREDAIFSGMEMIMIVGLWRFVSTRRPADFYIFCAGLALMFTIKETAFLSLAVFAVLFVLLFAYQAGYAILGALVGYGVAAGALFMYINGQMKANQLPQLPNIPDTNPNWERINTFAVALLTHPLVWGIALITVVFAGIIIGLFVMEKKKLAPGGPARIRSLAPRKARPAASVGNGAVPATQVAANGKAASGSTVPLSSSGNGSAPAVETANQSAAPEVGGGNGNEDNASTPAAAPAGEAEVTPLWNPRSLTPKRRTLLARYQPGSMPHLVGALFARPSVLLIGFAIAATIFIVFYSVFFTDVPRGIASGLFASLGYWMAQHEVERGGQPWFFYLLIIPLYEPIAAFFSLAAGILFSWKGIRWLRNRRAETARRELPHLGAFNVDRDVPFASFNSFLVLFIVWWLLGTLFIYSWAGEKMPWLMMHMVRPAIFLASLFVGALFLSMIRRRQERIEAARAWEEEYEDDYDAQPMRRRSPAGAYFKRLGASPNFRFSIFDFGLKKRRPAGLALAYAGVGQGNFRSGAEANPKSENPKSEVYYSRSQAAAQGRRSGRGMVEQPVYRTQEPPWVSWNRADSWFPFASYLTIFMLLGMGWGLSMSQFGYDVQFRNGNYGSWGMTWIYPTAMLVLTVAYAVWLGVGRALRYLGVGILSIMLLYQFRTSFMLSYRQPDVSTELASYVQTSPDVTRTLKELEAYSYLTTGDKSLKFIYDTEVAWPMEWYLRDYPNKQFIGASKPTPGDDIPVMFVGYQWLNDEELKQRYIPQRYALRWWFPQEWYMDEFIPNRFEKDANGAVITDPETGESKEASPFAQVGGALNTTWLTLTEPELQSTLWKYLLYREPPKPLGSSDFVLMLRKDIAPLWHNLQNEPPPSTDVP